MLLWPECNNKIDTFIVDSASDSACLCVLLSVLLTVFFIFFHFFHFFLTFFPEVDNPISDVHDLQPHANLAGVVNGRSK